MSVPKPPLKPIKPGFLKSIEIAIDRWIPCGMLRFTIAVFFSALCIVVAVNFDWTLPPTLLGLLWIVGLFTPVVVLAVELDKAAVRERYNAQVWAQQAHQAELHRQAAARADANRRYAENEAHRRLAALNEEAKRLEAQLRRP